MILTKENYRVLSVHNKKNPHSMSRSLKVVLKGLSQLFCHLVTLCSYSITYCIHSQLISFTFSLKLQTSLFFIYILNASSFQDKI